MANNKTIVGTIKKKQNDKTMFWVISGILLAVSFIIAGILNLNNSVKSVFVARTFLSEGTIINETNFDQYIGEMIIPLKTYNNIKKEYNVQLLEADLPSREKSKQYILGNPKYGIMPKNSIRYNLEAGDYVSVATLEINTEIDPIKKKLLKLGKMSGGITYDAKTINLPPNEFIQTKGLGKYEDYIRIQTVKEDKATGKLKIMEKYKNVPIIDWKMTGTNITSLVIALPKELASTYELDKQETKKMVTTFNPFKSEIMKFVGKDTLTQGENEEADKQGITYDIKDYIKVQNIKK